MGLDPPFLICPNCRRRSGKLFVRDPEAAENDGEILPLDKAIRGRSPSNNASMTGACGETVGTRTFEVMGTPRSGGADAICSTRREFIALRRS